ncbi:hypothetical protein [Kitasatospora sp. DSM 101779]|uniref:hypothetical protein n=1 Tax=Kitasatospora sp. DSM 101779 TaxID=2853165 RepID=UPI0021D86405|nr:hypothetical protein [Kitasatospora sp. DSM 101779]MCU7826332.1 hypothetical protein [Kitasatospora sp. DSM 101779]
MTTAPLPPASPRAQLPPAREPTAFAPAAHRAPVPVPLPRVAPVLRHRVLRRLAPVGTAAAVRTTRHRPQTHPAPDPTIDADGRAGAAADRSPADWARP